jgi:hypothetical protein
MDVLAGVYTVLIDLNGEEDLIHAGESQAFS